MDENKLNKAFADLVTASIKVIVDIDKANVGLPSNVQTSIEVLRGTLHNCLKAIAE